MENRMKNVQKIMSMLLLFMALPLAGMEDSGASGDTTSKADCPWWQSKTALTAVGGGTAAVGGWAAYKLLAPKKQTTVIEKVVAYMPSGEAVAQAGKQGVSRVVATVKKHPVLTGLAAVAFVLM